MHETRLGKARVLLEVAETTSDQKTIIGGFKTMSGMDSETEIVEFKDEKGAIQKKPGRTTYSNIVLERGFIKTDELWQWRKNIEDGQIDRRSGSIIILDQDGETEVARFNFYEGWPCKWYVPEVDAYPEIAIEKIEIAIEKVERVLK